MWRYEKSRYGSLQKSPSDLCGNQNDVKAVTPARGLASNMHNGHPDGTLDHPLLMVKKIHQRGVKGFSLLDVGQVSGLGQDDQL